MATETETETVRRLAGYTVHTVTQRLGGTEYRMVSDGDWLGWADPKGVVYSEAAMSSRFPEFRPL